MPVYLDRLVTTLDAPAMAGCGRAPVRVQAAKRPPRAALFWLSQISADCRRLLELAPDAHRLTGARPIRVFRLRRPLGHVPNALFPMNRSAVRCGNIIHSQDRKLPFSNRMQA